jgi:5-(hydroxymethyl)furfural/furfural oxidase
MESLGGRVGSIVNQTIDVIIVGAGPAGCVLASRLSEESRQQILLIEAGPDATVPGAEHPDLLDPFALTGSSNPTFHWPGLMAEMNSGSDGALHPYLQGYGLGGASNINGMGMDRGHPGDYDSWRDLGAEGWSWNEVLPYFKKLERDLDFPSSTVLSMHGDSGPMPIRRLPRSLWAPFAAAIGEALQRRGFPFIEDYIVDFRDGFSSAPTNCLPERRVSASMAYLNEEVRRRPNLKIMTNSRVDCVSIEQGCANGVFVHTAGVRTFMRSRHVILACGAIQSPALLMRSGIGPRGHLVKHRIDVVRDIPGVGANLQNHPYVAVATYLPHSAHQPSDNPWLLQNWLRFSSNHPECDPSDMHVIPLNKSAWHALGKRVGAVAVSVFKAYSTGCVELASNDPAASPKVSFNMLGDSRDFERLVTSVRFVMELLTDPAVSNMRREIFLPKYPLVARLSRRTPWNAFKARVLSLVLDCAPLRRALLSSMCIDPAKLRMDEHALRDFVRKNTQVQYHVCGTCRMGAAGDPDAVVDSTGRVHGVEALRVADASIFPTIPRANTHLTVLMVAEKIADNVKADWRSAAGSSPMGANNP